MPDALHVVGGLRLEGGRDRDNTPTEVSITKQKPGEDVSLKLILAGLAGENNDKGEARVMEDGFLDGKGNAALVGAEMDTAGEGPAERVAADGFTDTDGEGI